MVSFTGVQIQSIAQGYLVYEMTGDVAKLGFVMFATLLPVSLFGPILGVFSDVLDRRKIMVVASVILSAGAAFLGFAAHYGFIQYWHIVAVAVVSGFVLTIENPSRQSIVREVVPDEHLAAAVPAMGMTFNLARVAGPALGAALILAVGPELCFWVNAVTFSAIIFATLAIRTDISAKHRETQPIRDLITEGMLYTMRQKSLRTLFLLESTTSLCGIFYLALMPAIAKDMLGLGPDGLGDALSSVGLGALLGLILMMSISHMRIKPLLVRIAMSVFAVSMISVAFVREPWVAFVLFGLMGAATMMQFNTTNTLFQLIAPERLRGRVLSMHMWAIMGVSPIGILAFGWISRQTSLQVAFLIGGGAIGVGAIVGWLYRGLVQEPVTG